jgi:hemerythrin
MKKDDNKKKIQKFNQKSDFFNYIKDKFNKEDLIMVHGSTAYERIKSYSDFDMEIHGKKVKKPYYEIIFIKEKPVLVSVYFKLYNKGTKIKPPKGIKLIKGIYTDKTDTRFIRMYQEGHYNQKEKLKRECQLIADFCFKYFRSKDRKYMQYVQKRIN